MHLVGRTRIYVLNDPRSADVRYVGKTIRTLTQRLDDHIAFALSGKINRPLCIWIRELLSHKLKPNIEQIQEVDGDGNVAEIAQINYHKTNGDLLLNISPGGGGGTRSHVIKWTPDLIELLGKRSDNEIASILQVNRKSVSYMRRKLGIPTKQQVYMQKEFLTDPLVIARLGKEADKALARELGYQVHIIKVTRESLGISPCAQEHPYKINDLTDPQILARLGVESDSKIARDTGNLYRVVRRTRENLKIPPYTMKDRKRNEEEKLRISEGVKTAYANGAKRGGRQSKTRT